LRKKESSQTVMVKPQQYKPRLPQAFIFQTQVLLFVYICIVFGEPIIKRGVWDPINWFNPASSLCLSQDLYFQLHIWWSILCSIIWDGRWLFCFVDIGGIIVDHYCLNFLFITEMTKAYERSIWQAHKCGEVKTGITVLPCW